MPRSKGSSDTEMHDFQYLHSISPAGRLLPSNSKWNSIEFNFSLLPQSSNDVGSLPSRFSKNVDFNLVIMDKTYFKRFILISVALILSVIALILVLHFWPNKHELKSSSHDLRLALSQALLFFDAQKSGYYPKDSLVNFRGDSGTRDGNTSSVKADLVGGFYDSGNNIKFSFPTAYTVTLLSWSIIEYHDKYADVGELDHIKDIVKWGSDYLLKVFVSPNNSSQATLYSQVGGNGNETENDINCWQRPEDMKYPRPMSICTELALDLAGEIVAACSAASMVFKGLDKDFSEKLIKSAEDLFNIAMELDLKNHGHTYTENDECGGQARQFYNSSGYKDELIWGGTWLFFATGNVSYLDYATEKILAVEEDELSLEEVTFYWNNKLIASQILLTRLRFFRDLGYPYEDAFGTSSNRIDLLMCAYLDDTKFVKTNGGLILLNPDDGGSLEYSMTASFLSKLYSDYLALLPQSGSRCNDFSFSHQMLRQFSMSQVNYVLGDNPMKISYMVGYGEKYPKQVHHRAASIPWDHHIRSCEEGKKFLKSREPNPNVISGAMVGGPDQNDNFRDERENAIYNEPTIASNAGLVAALVALLDYNGDRYDFGMDKIGMFDNIRLVT